MVNRVMSVSEKRYLKEELHRVLQWSNIWGLLHKAPWNLQMVC
jgi:hypothetical protein